MLVLEHVSKVFGDARAVDNVSIAVPKGAFVGVIGRSGAGKSTLLRMINRLTEPSAGRVLWDGRDVSRLRGRALRDWRRRCAMIFQQFNLVGRLDALDNVLLGRVAHTPAWRSLTKSWSAEDRLAAMAALDQFDIAPMAARRTEHLSGGQQQRVAICRALMQEPEIILADEPIASLDPRNSRIVMDALRRINGHYGVTVLVNLHSIEIARAYCSRLVGMAQGRVVFEGGPEALTDEAARALYGVEAADIVGPAGAAEEEEAALAGAMARGAALANPV